MNAQALLTDIQQLGVYLEARGDKLHVEASENVLTSKLVAALKAHKPELLKLLSQPGKPRAITDDEDQAAYTEPFNQAAMDAIKAGQPVKVWSDVLTELVVWVRGEEERKELLSQGCTLPIYTLGELTLVVKMDESSMKRIHQIKKTFNGTITR